QHRERFPRRIPAMWVARDGPGDRGRPGDVWHGARPTRGDIPRHQRPDRAHGGGDRPGPPAPSARRNPDAASRSPQEFLDERVLVALGRKPQGEGFDERVVVWTLGSSQWVVDNQVAAELACEALVPTHRLDQRLLVAGLRLAVEEAAQRLVDRWFARLCHDR